jgi:arylsulfatase A-like enzyme
LVKRKGGSSGADRVRRALNFAFQQRRRDLALTTCVELAYLTVGTIVAKALIVSFAFGEASLPRRLWLTLKTLPVDLLVTGGAAGLVVLLAPRVRVPRRGRLLVAAAVVAVSQFLLFATFANVEFFGSWGSPLTFDLLRLAPNLAGYILLVGVSNVSGTLTLWAVLAVTGLLGLPLLQAHVRTGLLTARGQALLRRAAGVTVLVGGCLLAVTPREHREASLRNLNLLSLFVPGWRAPRDVAASPLSAEDQAALRRLHGPATDDGEKALQPLRGRRPNVVLWIWESVSARHLASLHPLGQARTPNLDRMMAAGSVRFTAAYAECPLTVQTTWALLTGRRPPAKPFVFVEDGPLPPHGPTLQGEMRRAGYRTATFYSSYTRMWGTRRLFELEPWGVFEDADAFVARGGHAVSGIGVEDDAIVERALDWIGGPPGKEPFFLLLWNTETHRPYTWAGMPVALESASYYDRFLAVIERGDSLLGRLHSELAARGLLDDTVVVVVGDHGEAFGRGARPWHWSHASQVFEDEIHVPLVMMHPRLKRATVSTPCGHADLYPTLLDFAGRDLPPGLDGRSLARAGEPQPVFARATLWWPLAIRTGDFKLILPEPTVAPLLYDIAADPEERNDLSGTKRDVARVLTSALLWWHSERFRTDPTFGYKMPPLRTLLGGAMDTPPDKWLARPSGPSSPEPTPSPGDR